MRILIRAGARPDLADGWTNRWTPLMHAVHKGQRESVRTLLEAGAPADQRERGQATPLIMAAAYGDPEIVRLLLAAGADPWAEAPGGVTALSNAAGGGALFDITDGPPFGACHAETVRLLLARAPGLARKPGLARRAAGWMGRGRECRQVAAMLDAS